MVSVSEETRKMEEKHEFRTAFEMADQLAKYLDANQDAILDGSGVAGLDYLDVAITSMKTTVQVLSIRQEDVKYG